MTHIILTEVEIAARRPVERHREISQDRDDAIGPEVVGPVKEGDGSVAL